MKNSASYKILIGLLVTGVTIFVLIKFITVIGIALAVIVFLVILGCSKKQ